MFIKSHRRLLECWAAAGRPLPPADKVKLFEKGKPPMVEWFEGNF